MDTSWRIELLGYLRVRQAPQDVIRIEPGKQGGALAYLALHSTQFPARETLIEALWPETDVNIGRARLRVTLTALRRLLEPPGTPPGSVLVANRNSIYLHPDAFSTDVGDLEALLAEGKRARSLQERTALLSKALDCYKGELLADWYDSWIDLDRQRAATFYGEALGQMTAALEDCGDLKGAIEYAERTVSMDPLREEAHCNLMRLYAAIGQPASALRQYRQLELLLRRELQESPTEVARILVAEIRNRGAQFASEATDTDADAYARSAPLISDYPVESPAAIPSPDADSSIAFPPLPLLLSPFFDRVRERERLKDCLRPSLPYAGKTDQAQTMPDSPGNRLVTLTGPGGIGKTRLALEAAQDLRDAFSGAVGFVPLANLSHGDQVHRIIAEALHLPHTNDSDMPAALEQALQRPSLLVLDNFEHLAATGGTAISLLLQKFPQLRLLVTSRQRLHVPGERELSLAPLPVPSEACSPEQLVSYACVQLFVNRAQSARPDFALTEANAESVAKLCRWLEGLPLALEIAAEWIAVLTPSQMLARMHRRLDLTGRTRTTAARHSTLRAAVEGSYGALSPDLQRFLARLSIMGGSWPLEAAETVCAEPLALQYLAELRERSMVMVEEMGDEMCFRILEMVRERAAENLSFEEQNTLAERYALYAACLFGEAPLHAVIEVAAGGSGQAITKAKINGKLTAN